jgi:transcriptional regulator with XRE-family HTH domain
VKWKRGEQMTKIEVKRKDKNLTQQEIAEYIDSSIGGYNMYENNRRKIPRKKAEKIAEILKCEISEIFLPSTFTASEN